MVTSSHVMKVADQFRLRLNGLAYLTIGRCEGTDSLRQVSGEAQTRLKRGMAKQLDSRLLEMGILAVPGLQDTTTGPRFAFTAPGQRQPVLRMSSSTRPPSLTQL